MNPPHDFGTWLRQLRTERDLTQESLAEAVGCASQTVRSFESGRRRPSREMAARLAAMLAVPDDEQAAFVRLARAPLVISTPPGIRAVVDAPSTGARHAVLSSPVHQLIGRHHDQERLRRALLDDGRRLLTLLGPGGVGKTSLALQTVADLRGYGADGAVAALASVSDLAGVVAACAAAVSCPLTGIADPQAALLTFLRERSLLIVLDNLEHLLAAPQGDAIVDFISAVLREAPSVSLLVTSRERLRLQAEWVIEIGGLSLPADDRASNIARSDAVLLFVERARRVASDFALGPHNQETVAHICRRLDGLPLALELAAAQISFLPPATLLARLDQALPLLEGGARDLPARQRTMRATIGWSHTLLPETERQLFERLGVFVGSWSLEAAEAVGAGGEIAPTQVLGLLRRLVDRSLVVRDAAGTGDVFYRLLEPVRQYALERLEVQAAESEATQQRHVAFFVQLATQLGAQLRTPQSRTAFDRLMATIEQIYPNVQAAINWSLARNEIESVAIIGGALKGFWMYRGQPREAHVWMEAALAQRERLPASARGQALLAFAATTYGHEPAQTLRASEEALACFQQTQSIFDQAQALYFFSLAEIQLGDYSQAEADLQRTSALAQQAGSRWLAGQTQGALSLLYSAIGDYARAMAYANQLLATAEADNDAWNMLSALFYRLRNSYAQDELAEYARISQEWLAFIPNIAMVNASAVAFAVEGVAVGAALAGAHERAARLMGAADAMWDIAGKMLLILIATDREPATAALHRQLSTEELAPAWVEGRAMNVVEAVAYALEANDAGR